MCYSIGCATKLRLGNSVKNRLLNFKLFMKTYAPPHRVGPTIGPCLVINFISHNSLRDFLLSLPFVRFTCIKSWLYFWTRK